jgi:hypothetical protein
MVHNNVQAPCQHGPGFRSIRSPKSATATPIKVLECLQKQFAAHGTLSDSRADV